jgi:uncharacterized protein YndB with AHSA1/START domain
MTEPITIERTYDASAQDIWDLWTTKEGIEAWWAPDGFAVEVRKLELAPGGVLLYAMAATAPQQVEFMRNAGMPLTNEAQKTYTEVVPLERLRYTSVIDFVPGVEPYDHDTLVDLHPSDGGVRVVMTIEPLRDEDWTGRLVAGRANEMDNLARLIAARSG